MNAHVLFPALLLLCVSGFVDGSLGLILKFPKSWKWEHMWLTYTLIAFAILPWVVGVYSVPHLFQVLSSADRSVVALTFAFGAGWGCGAILYGLALNYAGMALSYAIVMGLTAAIGSIAPLILLHSKEAFTLKGQIIFAAVTVVVISVTICAWAGHLKEKVLAADNSQVAGMGQKPLLGVLFAIMSGVLSPMINLSFAYGTPLIDHAVEMGANVDLAPNIIWAIALSAGGIVNVAYCAFLISRNRSWNVMSRWSWDYLLGIVMGILGPVSYILYGIGSTRLGTLGPVIGWPIMSSMGIIGANIWGALTGEWKGAGKASVFAMATAVVLLVCAMFVLGWVETIQ